METFKYNTKVYLVKGTDENNKGKMLMRGVASTSSKDSEGHNLNPSGFDTSYFLQKGFMNWNHEWKKNPLSIVGKPTKANINKKNELEIEYELFKGHKMAEEVYALAGVLDENGLYLGLSIEGEVIETDPKNKNKITKAKITDCAITPHPKNKGTVTKLIKGHNFQELVDFEKLGDFSIGTEGELILKGTETEEIDNLQNNTEIMKGGDSKQVAKGDGMYKGPDGEMYKSEQEYKDKMAKSDKNGKKSGKKSLSKGEMFNLLASMRPGITIREAEGIFNHTVNFEKSMNMSQITEVSEEAFQGALEQLGLSKGTATGELETPEAPATVVNEEGAPEAPATTEDSQPAGEVAPQTVVKSESAKPLDQMTAEERAAHKAELVKSLATIDNLDKAATPTTPEKPVEGSELLKSITTAIVSSEERISKAQDEKLKAVGTIANQAVELVKSLQSKVLKMEGEPVGQRSITTTGYQAKPGETLQKGEGGQVLGAGGEVYSVSQQKPALATRLTDAAIEKAGNDVGKMDPRLKADLVALEFAGHVSDTVQNFAKSLNIQIIA